MNMEHNMISLRPFVKRALHWQPAAGVLRHYQVGTGGQSACGVSPHLFQVAVAAGPDGGQVAIVKGSYPASAGNTFTAGGDGKAMTLIAPVGTVTIGN